MLSGVRSQPYHLKNSNLDLVLNLNVDCTQPLALCTESRNPCTQTREILCTGTGSTNTRYAILQGLSVILIKTSI